jgi:hypothetical protein
VVVEGNYGERSHEVAASLDRSLKDAELMKVQQISAEDVPLKLAEPNPVPTG